MTQTATTSITHEGARFRETLIVQAESGRVSLTWIQGREITRWTESIAAAVRARENFRRARLITKAREDLAELGLTLAEGRAVRDYYLAKFYDPKYPMRCHW